MPKQFIDLKRDSKRDGSHLPQYRFAILGDCATQHLAVAVKGSAYSRGMALSVFDADYNQIEMQTIDASSELYEFRPDATLIYMCSEKLYSRFCDTPLECRPAFADTVSKEILGYWKRINGHIKTNILQMTFVELDDGVFGSYGSRAQSSFLYQLRKLNLLLMDGCQRFGNVFPVDLAALQNEYGRQTLHDDKFYYIAKMPLSMEILPAVAERIVDVLCALSGRFKKCVVLDLDNTIWGGVIGDDGIENIQIRELGTGHAFTDLQMWLKEL